MGGLRGAKVRTRDHEKIAPSIGVRILQKVLCTAEKGRYLRG